jgi:hypothetical protein
MNKNRRERADKTDKVVFNLDSFNVVTITQQIYKYDDVTNK